MVTSQTALISPWAEIVAALSKYSGEKVEPSGPWMLAISVSESIRLQAELKVKLVPSAAWSPKTTSLLFPELESPTKVPFCASVLLVCCNLKVGWGPDGLQEVTAGGGDGGVGVGVVGVVTGVVQLASAQHL